MFDLEQFVEDCRAARRADSSHKLVREVVARAVSDAGGVLKSLGDPKRAAVQKLYHAQDLTILNISLLEGPFDVERAMRRFEEANELFKPFVDQLSALSPD